MDALQNCFFPCSCHECVKPPPDYHRLSSTGFKSKLARRWLREMREKELKFATPKLNAATCTKLYTLCKMFRQDAHVFATAVRMLESYLRYLRRSERQLNNPLLALIVVLYTAGKLSGNPWSYRVRRVAMVYRSILEQEPRQYDRRLIVQAEMTLLKALDFRIPLVTEADDLATLLYMHIRPLHVDPAIDQMAYSLLVVYLVHRQNIYHRLMRTYMRNFDLEQDFRRIVANRYFAPLGAIIGAFREMHAADGRAWQVMRDIGIAGNVAWNIAKRLAGMLRNKMNCQFQCSRHRLESERREMRRVP